MPESDRALVGHMLQALDRVAELVQRIDEDRFRSDWVLQNAMIHELQIFGEAAGRLSTGVQDLTPELPWRKITGLRHKVVHDYFVVDLGLIWDTAIKDMPSVRPSIQKLRKALE